MARNIFATAQWWYPADLNMQLWTAFLFGLIGSAHCAGMCGPLALALPSSGNSRAQFLVGRLIYNSGRIVTYAALGGLFGVFGRTFAMAGLQRWVSLAAGAMILIGVIASPGVTGVIPVSRVVQFLKSALARHLRLGTFGSLFWIGLLNGFLPCGLVYAACAVAITLGNIPAGMEYMILFGLGTVPMMLAFSLAGKKIQWMLRFKLQRVLPIFLALAGGLLLLRGLDLGIPYLSPKLSLAAGARQCCSEPK